MRAAITLRSSRIELTIPLGRGAAVPSDGFGGWTEIERPDGVALTSWTGYPTLKVDVPVMFNGWPRDSVQRDVDKLLKLGRGRDGEEAPPVFRATGPFFFSGMRMVMNGTPDFDGAELIRDDRGRLLRLPAVLHLMEYVKPDQIRLSRSKKGKFTYITKKGDTVRSIALRIFRDAGLIPDIKRLNNIRDPRKELKPGTMLVLPGDVPEFGPSKGDG